MDQVKYEIAKITPNDINALILLCHEEKILRSLQLQPPKLPKNNKRNIGKDEIDKLSKSEKLIIKSSLTKPIKDIKRRRIEAVKAIKNSSPNVLGILLFSPNCFLQSMS